MSKSHTYSYICHSQNTSLDWPVALRTVGNLPSTLCRDRIPCGLWTEQNVFHLISCARWPIRNVCGHKRSIRASAKIWERLTMKNVSCIAWLIQHKCSTVGPGDQRSSLDLGMKSKWWMCIDNTKRIEKHTPFASIPPTIAFKLTLLLPWCPGGFLCLNRWSSRYWFCGVLTVGMVKPLSLFPGPWPNRAFRLSLSKCNWKAFN